MTDDICGYDDTTTGEPCRHAPTEGERCWQHVDPNDPVPNGGRPAFIDDQQAKDDFLEGVENGLNLNHAAQLSRFSYRTVRRALDQGEEHDENGIESDYRQFWQEFNAREARGILKRMKQVSPEHFVATKGYAKTEKRELTGAEGSPLKLFEVSDDWPDPKQE